MKDIMYTVVCYRASDVDKPTVSETWEFTTRAEAARYAHKFLSTQSVGAAAVLYARGDHMRAPGLWWLQAWRRHKAGPRGVVVEAKRSMKEALVAVRRF